LPHSEDLAGRHRGTDHRGPMTRSCAQLDITALPSLGSRDNPCRLRDERSPGSTALRPARPRDLHRREPWSGPR
jgi:hypothetical protein